MKVATAAQMRRIDSATIKEFGIPSLVLMERAALSVVKRIKGISPSPKKTIVLAGSGNNGGDGLAVARMLKNEGWNVKAFLIKTGSGLSVECKAQLETAKKFGVEVFNKPPEPADFHSAIIVDAIFGTGLGRPIEGPVKKIIEVVNGFPENQVIAVDIPSGINSDTGGIMGTAIKATCTVTFGLPKPGLLLHPGREHAGRLFIEDIGFPSILLGDPAINCQLTVAEDISSLLPERPPYSNKGDFGHVLLLAGSSGKTGAALLGARAALRTGAGLVTMGVPEDTLHDYQANALDEMTFPLPSASGGLSAAALDEVLRFMTSRGSVLAMGPGLGVTPDIIKLVWGLVKSCASPMVIDADALTALKENPQMLRQAKAPAILTPHPGEASRLLGTSVKEIEQDRIGAARRLAELTGAYVVLKGVPTITAEPEGSIHINSTGTPAMAKAGMGDVLTGMVAALLAQGLPPADASVAAVYIHGLAGEIARRMRGSVYSVLASDLHETISLAFEELIKSEIN
ncbi:MAG: NAD(P)H-hydrate dehydratase [Nitrospiraceae bacterium]|nr:NAD(P)H-hydrate dehydratase [Nitrospiraceae bacterium]